MSLTILILFLAIALGGIAIAVIIGWVKPWAWACAGLVSGTTYFLYIEAWANYNDWVLVPAVETLMGTRVPGVWEYASIFSLVVFIFMIGVFLYSIMYSWIREGLVRPFYERLK